MLELEDTSSSSGEVLGPEAEIPPAAAVGSSNIAHPSLSKVSRTTAGTPNSASSLNIYCFGGGSEGYFGIFVLPLLVVKRDIQVEEEEEEALGVPRGGGRRGAPPCGALTALPVLLDVLLLLWVG